MSQPSSENPLEEPTATPPQKAIEAILGAQVGNPPIVPVEDESDLPPVLEEEEPGEAAE